MIQKLVVNNCLHVTLKQITVFVFFYRDNLFDMEERSRGHRKRKLAKTRRAGQTTNDRTNGLELCDGVYLVHMLCALYCSCKTFQHFMICQELVGRIKSKAT